MRVPMVIVESLAGTFAGICCFFMESNQVARVVRFGAGCQFSHAEYPLICDAVTLLILPKWGGSDWESSRHRACAARVRVW